MEKSVNPVFHRLDGRNSKSAVMDMKGNIPIPIVVAIPICMALIRKIAASLVCAVRIGLHRRRGQRSSHHTKKAVIALRRAGYPSRYCPN